MLNSGVHLWRIAFVKRLKGNITVSGAEIFAKFRVTVATHEYAEQRLL